MAAELAGDESTARIISRSVAQGSSKQVFQARLVAYGRGRGQSIPEIWAENAGAELVH